MNNLCKMPKKCFCPKIQRSLLLIQKKEIFYLNQIFAIYCWQLKAWREKVRFTSKKSVSLKTSLSKTRLSTWRHRKNSKKPKRWQYFMKCSYTISLRQQKYLKVRWLVMTKKSCLKRYSSWMKRGGDEMQKNLRKPSDLTRKRVCNGYLSMLMTSIIFSWVSISRWLLTTSRKWMIWKIRCRLLWHLNLMIWDSFSINT